VVWYGYDGNDSEIYFWNGNTTTQVTNDSTGDYYDYYPQISGNNVVWTRSDGNDYEIYFWDGSTITQVTNNSTDDNYPQISGNNIIWSGYDNIYFDTIVKENFTTTAQLDTINARGGNDTVTSTFANLQQGDFIKGGTGTDTLIITAGTSAKSVAIDLNNSASQVLNRSGTTISGFERFDLSSFLGTTSFLGTADNNWIKSGAGNDDLGGGDGNDYLNGGKGADLLGGGKGDDTYIVDNSGDIIAEFLNSGTDTVESSLTWTLKANLENLTLTGSANLNGTGNSLNNTLTGNTGNNVLDGGAGTDRLVGGLGNDTYLVDSNRDVVVEKAGEGKDTVQSTATHSLTDNVENLALLGTTNINGTGNGFDNLITGNSGNNLLKGLDGYDTLIGGAGNDTFIGGAGNDTLTGGAGNDQFLFGSGAKFTPTHFGVDTVTDFVKGTDKISLSKVSFTALTSAVGNLNSSEFALINSAVNELFLAGSSSAKIVYNSATGNLFYNQNAAIAGLGTGGSFATLSGLPSLGATDFLVQA
jgi:Ca2+-binding RTX toxin-like protein